MPLLALNNVSVSDFVSMPKHRKEFRLSLRTIALVNGEWRMDEWVEGRNKSEMEIQVEFILTMNSNALEVKGPTIYNQLKSLNKKIVG